MLLWHCSAYPVDSSRTTGTGNYISIRGSSNVTDFELINRTPFLNEATGKAFPEEGYKSIQIPVEGFSGPNKQLTNDFRDMVNASEYPLITIALEQKDLASLDEKTGLTHFRTFISMSGNTREYVIPCEVYEGIGSGYILKGSLEVLLSDFGIDPPRKVFGLIRVENEVFINFVFRFDYEEFVTEKVQF